MVSVITVHCIDAIALVSFVWGGMVMSQDISAHVIVTGRVQGVYYRVSMTQEAHNLGVTGWVKNRPDGAVEAVIEGKREKVVKLIDWCRQGPPASQVTDLQVKWEDFRGEYQDFCIVS